MLGLTDGGGQSQAQGTTTHRLERSGRRSLAPGNRHRPPVGRTHQGMPVQLVLESRHDDADLQLARIGLWMAGGLHGQRPGRPRSSFRPGHTHLLHCWSHPGAAKRRVLPRPVWLRGCLDERGHERPNSSHPLSAAGAAGASSTTGSPHTTDPSRTTHSIPWMVQLQLGRFPPREFLDR